MSKLAQLFVTTMLATLAVVRAQTRAIKVKPFHFEPTLLEERFSTSKYIDLFLADSSSDLEPDIDWKSATETTTTKQPPRGTRMSNSRRSIYQRREVMVKYTRYSRRERGNKTIRPEEIDRHGNICYGDDDCDPGGVSNLVCLKKYYCKQGQCICRSEFSYNGSGCVKKTYLKLHDNCTSSRVKAIGGRVFYQSGTTCSTAGVVVCTPDYAIDGENVSCVTKTKPHGGSCRSDVECTMPFQCDKTQFKCLCARNMVSTVTKTPIAEDTRGSAVYTSVSGCRPRQVDDECCSSAIDCCEYGSFCQNRSLSLPLSSDTPAATSVLYNTKDKLKELCTCKVGTTVLPVAMLQDSARGVENTNLCIRNGIYKLVSWAGSNCDSVQRVKETTRYADIPISEYRANPLMICQHPKLACSLCPEDNYRPVCRSVEDFTSSANAIGSGLLPVTSFIVLIVRICRL